MMWKLAVVVSLFMFSLAAAAQESVPKIEIFGGYSLLHADTDGASGASLDSFFEQPSGTFNIKTNYSGWNAEVQFNANRWLGSTGIVFSFGSQ